MYEYRALFEFKIAAIRSISPSNKNELVIFEFRHRHRRTVAHRRAHLPKGSLLDELVVGLTSADGAADDDDGGGDGDDDGDNDCDDGSNPKRPNNIPNTAFLLCLNQRVVRTCSHAADSDGARPQHTRDPVWTRVYPSCVKGVYSAPCPALRNRRN